MQISRCWQEAAQAKVSGRDQFRGWTDDYDQLLPGTEDWKPSPLHGAQPQPSAPTLSFSSATCVCVCVLSRFRHVRLCVTPWTAARQAPLSMGVSRQEYWSGLPCPLPGDLPDPGIEPASLLSPALATSATYHHHDLGSPSHLKSRL